MNPLDIKVLVVEDMQTVRTWEVEELKLLGFKQIFEAENGFMAEEILKKEKIDFVICDRNMPEVDGLALLEKIRSSSLWQSMAFMMVSAEAESHEILRAMELGANHYLTKPFSRDGFRAALKKICLIHFDYTF
jgi:two-component system chemotaxis response regulator CheY